MLMRLLLVTSFSFVLSSIVFADVNFLTAEPGIIAYLRTNERMVSPSGNFVLIMQGDGNLVMYRGDCVGNPNCAVWFSHTSQQVGDYFFALQQDGNAVIYRGTPENNQGIVWNPASNGAVDNYFIVLQDDANLVVYRGIGPTDERGAVWSTKGGLVPFDWGYPAGRSWVDVNTDGLADYCRVIGIKGVKEMVTCTLATASDQGQINPPSGKTIRSKNIDFGFNFGRAWVDINGDGKGDYCRVVGTVNSANSRVRCLLGNSSFSGFDSEIESQVIDWGYEETRAWVDANLDGILDFCRAVGDGRSPTLRCSITHPENIADGFSVLNETDFPKDQDEIQKTVMFLREETIRNYGLGAVAALTFVAAPKLFQIGNLLRTILTLKGDERRPSNDDDWTDIRTIIHDHTNFRGDAPIDRIERAGHIS